MKRRLSDHDEWAFDRLARCTETPSTSRRTGLPSERRLTSRVWVRNGWGYASDCYRLLCLPVDLDVDGSVSMLDALTGGTVDVEPLRDDDVSVAERADGMTWGRELSTTLPAELLRVLARWEGRRSPAVTSRPGYHAVPTTAMVVDGRDFHLAGATCTGSAVVLPAAILLPALAPVVAAIAETGGGVWIQPHPSRPVPVYGADITDGWGLVMPLLWRPTVEWAES